MNEPIKCGMYICPKYAQDNSMVTVFIGPYDPPAGHRFNAAKLLIDPYAKALTGIVKWSDAMFGYRVGQGQEDLLMDDQNNAGNVPKGVVVDQSFSWGHDRFVENPLGTDSDL